MGTQIFDNQIKDSILLTGSPTAPTPSVSDDSTRIATTEFVHNVFGEFYPVGVTPVYVDTTHFTVTGDLTAIFTKGRVLKITDTGGTFYVVVSESVYDTVTTVTVAGDTLDSGISAVYCAVSQEVGGIFESDSNANGEYVKFTDGLLLCWYAKSIDGCVITNITETDLGTWTYPVTYIENPIITNTPIGYASSRYLTAAIPTTTGATCYGFGVEGTSYTLNNSCYLTLIAVGRWY